MKHYIQAGQFKAQCLKIMDEVQISKNPIIITKHRVPIVQIIPISNQKKSLFGGMKGTIHIKGDIIKPINESWNADC